MKRIISFILAFIISITCIFSAGISYADNRPHIEDALIIFKLKQDIFLFKTRLFNITALAL